MPSVGEFYVPGPDEIRDNILRTLRNGLISRGVANPNVVKGSDDYLWAQAVANELSVGYANAIVKADQGMADTAVGAELDRVAGQYGLTRRGAQGAVGQFMATTYVTLMADQELQGDNGIIYKVDAGGTFAAGDYVDIYADGGGSASNLPAGSILAWIDPPPYSPPTVTIAGDGLVDGVDAEDDDALRTRLLERLRNPPAGGNWSQYVQWAEESNSAVHKAFCYPALDGPSTVGICLIGPLAVDLTTNVPTRIVDSAIVQKVAADITAKAPVGGNVRVASARDSNVNVTIGLSLPAAPTASTPGPGGGWLDAAPWPSIGGSANRVTVTAVASPTTFTVMANAASYPNVTDINDGVTQIAWWNPAKMQMEIATIRSHSGSAGTVTVTVDRAFNGIAVGDMISPAAARINDYAKALIAAFAKFGPGEWTADTNRLPRSKRHPFPSLSYPSSITSLQLKAASDAGEEVLDATWLYRSATAPSTPGATSVAPEILVPYRIGFYPI